jgi:hypothetical protein
VSLFVRLLFPTFFFFLFQACPEHHQERLWHEAGDLRGRSQGLSSSSTKLGTIWCQQFSCLLSRRQHKCGARGP